MGGLEDIAMFRTLPGATVFYPTDAVACERAVELAANTKGLCYIRLSRPATEILYDNDETFAIGKAKILKQSDNDSVLVIAAGITLSQAVPAVEQLTAKGINARLMDPFTIKPIDKEAILSNAKECGGRIMVVEDHYPEGGIGDAVAEVICDKRDIVLKRCAFAKSLDPDHQWSFWRNTVSVPTASWPVSKKCRIGNHRILTYEDLCK